MSFWLDNLIFTAWNMTIWFLENFWERNMIFIEIVAFVFQIRWIFSFSIRWFINKKQWFASFHILILHVPHVSLSVLQYISFLCVLDHPQVHNAFPLILAFLVKWSTNSFQCYRFNWIYYSCKEGRFLSNMKLTYL